MKKQIVLFIFIILVCTSSILALSEDYKIQTKQQAYEVAIQVTGFEESTFPFDSLVSNDIVLDTIFDENIPFWVPEDSGTLVWVVTFDELKYTPDKINKKTYKVYLKAKTKQLIKITGQEDVSKDFFFDKITKEAMRKVLYSSDFEEWLGFPDENCWLSFFEYIEPSSTPRTSTAKEIYVVRVYSTWHYKEPRIVWVIICNDMPYNKNDRFLSMRRSMTHLDGNKGGLINFTPF